MASFKTYLSGCSLKFSPFIQTRLAVAAAQNFGLLGHGRQFVLELTPSGIVEFCAFDTADSLFDCTWSEAAENVLVSAGGDGAIKIWDTCLPSMVNPVGSLEEHVREVSFVDWNPIRRDCVLSSSWDDSIKLWTLDRLQSMRTFLEHTYCVYAACWNRKHADIFASASGDCSVRIWDVREPYSTIVIPGHSFEILGCDWNTYNEPFIVTGSVDKSIKVWDVRNHKQPVRALQGHTSGIRRVKFSPHHENLIASCSYDMSVCVWDFRLAEDAVLARYDHHTESVLGLDMSRQVDGLLATTAWDETVFVWKYEHIDIETSLQVNLFS